MAVEQNTTVIAKKLWSVVRIMFYMMRKGLSKNKLWLDLHMMLKRGKLASKAIGNLMLDHQYSAFTCRSNDVHMSFVSPREYEFSCSNSPVYPSYYTKRSKSNHHKYPRVCVDDQIHVVQKVFDILNHNYEPVEASSSPLALPGFGKSPMVRQLRVTDSPFPVVTTEEVDAQVDKAAEDFINNFYKELLQQKKRAAIESPSPFHKWGR